MVITGVLETAVLDRNGRPNPYHDEIVAALEALGYPTEIVRRSRRVKIFLVRSADGSLWSRGPSDQEVAIEPYWLENGDILDFTR